MLEKNWRMKIICGTEIWESKIYASVRDCGSTNMNSSSQALVPFYSIFRSCFVSMVVYYFLKPHSFINVSKSVTVIAQLLSWLLRCFSSCWSSGHLSLILLTREIVSSSQSKLTSYSLANFLRMLKIKGWFIIQLLLVFSRLIYLSNNHKHEIPCSSRWFWFMLQNC